MKNMRIIFCSGLFSLIVILCIVAVCYYKTSNAFMYENQKYSENESESHEVGVKIVGDYEEFKRLIERDYNTFLVLGKTGCHYCELYLPVLNNISESYKIEIIYVDLLKITEDDYNAVMDSPLTIPSKCSLTGEDAFIKNGFGTPLTLFVNKGKTYDCIRGYQSESNLITSLKAVGYIN